jgi:ABC-type sugar transport system substrate-binding protein
VSISSWKRTLAVFGSAVLVVSLAACGSSAVGDGDSSAPATGSAGGDISGKTIGVWEALGAAEVQQRTLAAVQASTDALGWTAQVVDGEGDPSKMQQRLQSLVDAKVDAIVLIFPQPAVITSQLEAAKAAGIPVVSAGFVAEDTPLVATQYVADQVKMSQLLTERIKSDFPSGGNFAIINLPGYIGVTQRVDTFKSEITPEYKIVAEKDVPLTDVFGGTTKAGTDILNANPDLSAFFSCCDFGGQALAPALQQTGRDVPTYTFYAVPSVLDLVRAGKVTVAENDEAKTGAMAVDGLAHYFADGSALDAATQLEQFPIQYTVVDKTNAPAKGQDVYPVDQAVAPIIADLKRLSGS